MVHDDGRRDLVEQVAILDLGPGGIERLDLLCSGFQPEQSAEASDSVTVFDAGGLGCADGLAPEFRRRLAGVSVGGVLAVVVADPAAKADLPALARMLGHAVRSTEEHEDGRLTITVEKRR